MRIFGEERGGSGRVKKAGGGWVQMQFNEKGNIAVRLQSRCRKDATQWFRVFKPCRDKYLR